MAENELEDFPFYFYFGDSKPILFGCLWQRLNVLISNSSELIFVVYLQKHFYCECDLSKSVVEKWTFASLILFSSSLSLLCVCLWSFHETAAAAVSFVEADVASAVASAVSIGRSIASPFLVYFVVPTSRSGVGEFAENSNLTLYLVVVRFSSWKSQWPRLQPQSGQLRCQSKCQ